MKYKTGVASPVLYYRLGEDGLGSPPNPSSPNRPSINICLLSLNIT